MKIQGKVAVVTGAASGIGRAVARELAQRGAAAIGVVDLTECIASMSSELNAGCGREVAVPFQGDVTDPAFRGHVFDAMVGSRQRVSIVVPAAGITRDALAVRVDKTSGEASIYSEDLFRQVLDVNLVAPIYWVLEMMARIAEERHRQGLGRWQPCEEEQGVGVLIGSVSSQGNKGQISYATTKAGLQGAAATLMTEGIFHGIRSVVIHPGYTDTPMVRALGDEFIVRNILPFTQLRRLVQPEEIADAICFLITNAAVSRELWADAGWHPAA
jgi:3-oxoacyl-[acyl-carrier protein] reductase